MGKSKKKKVKDTEIIAVIDIGSSAIRMMVAELHADDWRILDSAERPVDLGVDVFDSGRISRKTLLSVLKILDMFKEMLEPYPILEIKAIGTSALREALNRDTFLDRVSLHTGIEIRIIEGVEANQLTYYAVQHAIFNEIKSFNRSNAIIMEVGGGSTEVMLLNKGQMVASHTLNLGTIRLEKMLHSSMSGADIKRFMEERLRGPIEILTSEQPLKRISKFIAVGGDARLVARKFGTKASKNHHILKASEFKKAIDKLSNLSIDDIVTTMDISYSDAEPLLTALLVYWLIFEQSGAKELIVPNVSIREGVLYEYIHLSDDNADIAYNEQVITSAQNLAKKYHSDKGHIKQVAWICLKLFDELQNEHGLDSHARLILEVSALLHDIGSFINPSAHHKHSQYIITNSEIFGLTNDDLRLVSTIARYHRKATPQKSHLPYSSMSREERLIVLKLAAILRVAESIDRGHTHRILEMDIKKTASDLTLSCRAKSDLSMEKISLSNRDSLFEEVYGMQVTLVRKK